MGKYKLLAFLLLASLLLIPRQLLAYTDNDDPDLRPGFPVFLMPYSNAVSFFYGQGLAIGDIDGEGQQTILYPTPTSHYVYAINPDGTLKAGWPVSTAVSPSVTLGNFLNRPNAQDVVLGGYGTALVDGNGVIQSGWPIDLNAPWPDEPEARDIDGDGRDEVLTFLPTIPYSLDAVNYQGKTIAAYNSTESGYCLDDFLPPLIVNSNGVLNIITRHPVFDGPYGALSCLVDFSVDGSAIYRKNILPIGHAPKDLSPVAYYDKTGQPVLVANHIEAVNNQGHNYITLRNANWQVEKRFEVAVPVDSAEVGGLDPVLADLDGDGIPEIIFTTLTKIYVYRVDGTPFPGWPRSNGLGVLFDVGDSLESAVGDIDGDGQPDIVITAGGKIAAFDRFGQKISGFPKDLNEPTTCSGVEFNLFSPAIADLDGDGFNELVVAGWRDLCGSTNLVPMSTVFAYDLGGFPGGRIEWGQIRGNAKRTDVYQATTNYDTSKDADLSYSINYNQPELLTGRDNTATITIKNNSSSTANQVTFNLSYSETAGTPAIALSGNSFTCIKTRGRDICRNSDLPGNSTTSLTLDIVGITPDDVKANAQVSQTGYESNLGNNFSAIDLNLLHLTAVAGGMNVSTALDTQLSGTLNGHIDGGYSGPLIFAIVKKSLHGKVNLTNPADGSFIYTPDAGFSGQDSFTFTVGNGDITSQPATVSIDVKPKQPAPKSGGSGGGGFALFGLAELFIVLLLFKLRTSSEENKG